MGFRTYYSSIAIFCVSQCILGLPVMQPEEYLTKYGYYNNEKSNHFFSNTKQTTMEESIKEFQSFAGLPKTGMLDSATKNLMKKPRCGISDVEPKQNTFSYSLPDRWTTSNLTYNIMHYTSDLKTLKTDDIIKKAFEKWSSVSPLHFHKVAAGSANMKISFTTRSHGDNYPFDGPGGVLAHAFSPPYGMVHFDDDELFNVGASTSGINLQWVAVHEFGHALGLQHSSVSGSIMYPFYPGSNVSPQLHTDDINKIQNLYGTPGNPSIINQATSTTTKKPPPKVCLDAFNTVVCQAWRRGGYCNNNTRVRILCNKTCNIC